MKSVLKISLLLLLVFGFELQVLAGAWSLGKNQGFYKWSVFYLNSQNFYASSNNYCFNRNCINGEKRNYFFNGELTSFATFADIRYGVTDKIDIDLLVPLYFIQYTDIANPNRDASVGLGDVFIGGRYNLLNSSTAISVGGQLKLPTGKFDKDAEVVPIGDGHRLLSVFGSRTLFLSFFFIYECKVWV